MRAGLKGTVIETHTHTNNILGRENVISQQEWWIYILPEVKDLNLSGN